MKFLPLFINCVYLGEKYYFIILIKNLYILIFSVNGIINIILHDLINLYAKI